MRKRSMIRKVELGLVWFAVVAAGYFSGVRRAEALMDCVSCNCKAVNCYTSSSITPRGLRDGQGTSKAHCPTAGFWAASGTCQGGSRSASGNTFPEVLWSSTELTCNQPSPGGGLQELALTNNSVPTVTGMNIAQFLCAQ